MFPNFLRNCHTDIQRGCISLHSCQKCRSVPSSPQPLQPPHRCWSCVEGRGVVIQSMPCQSPPFLVVVHGGSCEAHQGLCCPLMHFTFPMYGPFGPPPSEPGNGWLMCMSHTVPNWVCARVLLTILEVLLEPSRQTLRGAWF